MTELKMTELKMAKKYPFVNEIFLLSEMDFYFLDIWIPSSNIFPFFLTKVINMTRRSSKDKKNPISDGRKNPICKI